MAWVTPTTRATGYLVTAATWNQDVVNNPAYLKGQAGNIQLENNQEPLTDNVYRSGARSLRWLSAHAQVFRGLAVEERRISWDDPAVGVGPNGVFDTATGAGTGFLAGGSGQKVLQVSDNQVGTRRVELTAAINNGLAIVWEPAKNPYLRIGFNMAAGLFGRTNLKWFIGLRATPSGTALPVAAEHHMGLRFDGSQAANNRFAFVRSDGTLGTSLFNDAVITGGSQAVEMEMVSAMDIQFRIDGVVIAAPATLLPTTNLQWQLLIISDGTGGGTTSEVTIREIILQKTTP